MLTVCVLHCSTEDDELADLKMGSQDTEDGRPHTPPPNHRRADDDLVPDEGTEKLHPPAPLVETPSVRPLSSQRASSPPPPEVSGDREEEEEHKSREPAPVPSASAKQFGLTAGTTVKKLSKVRSRVYRSR